MQKYQINIKVIHMTCVLYYKSSEANATALCNQQTEKEVQRAELQLNLRTESV